MPTYHVWHTYSIHRRGAPGARVPPPLEIIILYCAPPAVLILEGRGQRILGARAMQRHHCEWCMAF